MFYRRSFLQAGLAVVALALASCTVNSPDNVHSPAQPSAPPETNDSNGDFSRSAASATLAASAAEAKKCKTADGPTGSTKVTVTFALSGHVIRAVLRGEPFAGTSVGACVAATFRSAKVPPFHGSPVSVTKSLTIN